MGPFDYGEWGMRLRLVLKRRPQGLEDGTLFTGGESTEFVSLIGTSQNCLSMASGFQFKSRGVACAYRDLMESLMSEFTETLTTERTVACRMCGGTDVVKDGLNGDSQFFLCRGCRTKFTGSDGFPRMRYGRETVVRALTYYYNGMSYRNVGLALKSEDRREVPKWTAWRWVTKYSRIVNDYAVTLPADVGPVWMADETTVFVFGKQYWFWDMIDTKTRFLLASHLSRVRSHDEAVKFFRMARWRAKTEPRVVLTDKLPAYYKAFNKVFYSPYPEKKAEHLTSSGFNSPTNINLLERFHGSLKAIADREPRALT